MRVMTVSDDGTWIQAVNGLWLPTVDPHDGAILLESNDSMVLEQSPLSVPSTNGPPRDQTFSPVSKGGGWDILMGGRGVTLSNDRHTVQFTQVRARAQVRIERSSHISLCMRE